MYNLLTTLLNLRYKLFRLPQLFELIILAGKILRLKLPIEILLRE